MSWRLKDLESSLLIGSTLVEGSTLSESEAKQVLAGKSVQGHPVSEIRELINYRAALEWLMLRLEAVPHISKDLILGFHERLFQGFPTSRGQWKTHSNYTYLSDGSRHEYAAPSRIEEEVAGWIARFNDNRHSGVAAPEAAARLYFELEEIHPFEDGNGRIGRVLIAYWLHWKARLSWTFRLKDKVAHLRALEAANHGDFRALEAFFRSRTRPERRSTR